MYDNRGGIRILYQGRVYAGRVRLGQTEYLNSVKNGMGQVYLHLETGEIMIMWATRFQSSYGPTGVFHEINYHVETADPVRVADMMGAPYLGSAFVHIGEFGRDF